MKFPRNVVAWEKLTKFECAKKYSSLINSWCFANIFGLPISVRAYRCYQIEAINWGWSCFSTLHRETASWPTKKCRNKNDQQLQIDFLNVDISDENSKAGKRGVTCFFLVETFLIDLLSIFISTFRFGHENPINFPTGKCYALSKFALTPTSNVLGQAASRCLVFCWNRLKALGSEVKERPLIASVIKDFLLP